MFSAAPAVVSVLVVIVLLDTLPVAATDAADTDPDVDIDPPVIDLVAVIVEVDKIVLPLILPCDAVMLPLKDVILPKLLTLPVDAVMFP